MTKKKMTSKEKRQAKKQAKLLKAQKAEASKFKGERGFGSPFGYIERDSYLFGRDKKVYAIYDVIFRYGTNHDALTGWVNLVIPRDKISSGSVRFFQRQKGMATGTEGTIASRRLNGMIESTSGMNDASAVVVAKETSKRSDMRLARQLLGNDEHIYDTDMMLVITAENEEKIEQAFAELETTYKNSDVQGVTFVRRTGTQWKEFQNLLVSIHADKWHNAEMLSTASGRLFLPSSGFSDRTGTRVGIDTQSYLRDNPSVIDFRGVHNAVIFTGGTSPYVSQFGSSKTSMPYNGGSAIAHAITDANYLNGRRTHHIVLSKHMRYRSGDSLSFDMNKEVINPFEVFGREETVSIDANANFEKVVNMMLMITNALDDKAMYNDLMALVVDWFVYRAGGGAGMYTKNPEREPHVARRILARADHENYPVPRDFISELQNNVVRESNRHGNQERADQLFKSISTSFDRYNKIFGATTTLPDVYKASDRNIYYDLSNLGDDNVMLNAMFLNVLAYVTHRALDGEMIVIHGLDNVTVPEKVIMPYRERIRTKNIGLVTVFEKSGFTELNPQTHQRFVGRLSAQDMVVLGGLNETEMKYLKESWQRELPETVRSELLSSPQSLFYFYRKRDYTGALIETMLNM